MADENKGISAQVKTGDTVESGADDQLAVQAPAESLELTGDLSPEQEVTSAADEPGPDADDSRLQVVFRLGSQQYIAKLFSWDIGEKIEGVTEDFHRVTDVLLATDGEKTVIGKPCIEGAHVEVEIDHDIPAARTVSFKRRRRKHSSRTTKGHAQRLVSFTVVGISVPGFAPESMNHGDSETET